MAVIITYLIMNIVRTYAIYSFIDNFLIKKRASNLIVFCGYGSYYFITAFIYFKSFTLLHDFIINLVMGFIICLLYKTRFFKKIFAAVFIYILTIVSVDCTTTILDLLYNNTDSTVNNVSKTLILVGIILSAVLLLGLVKLINPIFVHQIAEMPHTYWLSVFFAPSGSIYILHVLTMKAGNSHRLSLIAMTIIILLAINFHVFYLYRRLLHEEAIKFQNIILRRQNEDYKNQALLIQSYQKELRIQQHDIKNHLTSIKELAKNQQSYQLSKYIDTLLEDTKSIEAGINTGNTIIDAMINSKLYLATCQKTPFYMKIKISEELKINSTDLTIILGNLLDNALEACSKLPVNEREVQIEICYEHTTLTINISNPFNQSEINIREEKVYTTKKDKTSHGIGINRVQQIVEKYDGSIIEYDISHQDRRTIFTVNVLLYL